VQGTQKTNLLASGEGNAVADSGSQARAWEPTGLQALPGRAVEIVGLTSCFSIRFAAQCTSRIEDPVEFVFQDVKSLVNQREVGECVKDFATAMKHAVREDPDVILVGEMRDAESFETALHAAETGHLVFRGRMPCAASQWPLPTPHRVGGEAVGSTSFHDRSRTVA